MTTSAEKNARPTINNLRLFLILLAFSLRFLFGILQLSKPLHDPDRYIPFAQSLWSGDGFVYNGHATAYRPPLYPIIIAPLTGFFGEGNAFRVSLIFFQSIMGALTAALVMRITRSLAVTSSKTVCSEFIAGFLAAADPVLLSQASLPMTETLAALLLTAALDAIIRNRIKQTGLLFGLAALCRPSLLACTTIVIAALFYSRINIWRTALKQAIVISACTFLVILPWGIRNYFAVGWPVFTTTHGGYTFALANNPVYYDEVLHGPPGAVWSGERQQAWFDSIGPSVKGLSEHEMDQSLKRRTWAFVWQHPNDFARATIQRQAHFWAISPSSQVYGKMIRYSSTVWTLPFWVLVLSGLLNPKCRTWPGLSLIAAISGLAGVHLLYWTDIRMRAPIVPALAVLAGQSVCVSEICKRLSHSTKNDVTKL